MTDTEQLNIFDGFFRDLITEMKGSAHKLTTVHPRTNKEGSRSRNYAVATSDDFDYVVKNDIIYKDLIKRRSIIDFLMSNDFFEYLEKTFSELMYDYYVFNQSKQLQESRDRKKGLKLDDGQIERRANRLGYMTVITNTKTSGVFLNGIRKMLMNANGADLLKNLKIDDNLKSFQNMQLWKDIISGKEPIDASTFSNLDWDSKFKILDAFTKTKDYENWFKSINTARKVQEGLAKTNTRPGIFEFVVIYTNNNYGYRFEKVEKYEDNLKQIIYDHANPGPKDSGDKSGLDKIFDNFSIPDLYFWLTSIGITRQKLSECPGFMYIMNNELLSDKGDPEKAIRNLSMVKSRMSETFDVPYAGNKYILNSISDTNKKTFSQILGIDLSGILNATGIQNADMRQMGRLMADVSNDCAKLLTFADRVPSSLMDFYTKLYLVIKLMEDGPMISNAMIHIPDGTEKDFAEKLENAISDIKSGLDSVNPILIPVIQYAQFFDPRAQKSVSTDKKRYTQVSVGKKPTRNITLNKTSNSIKSIIEHGLFSAAMEAIESSTSNNDTRREKNTLSSILGTTIRLSAHDTVADEKGQNEKENTIDQNLASRLKTLDDSTTKFKNPIRRYIVSNDEIKKFIEELRSINNDAKKDEKKDIKSVVVYDSHNNIGHYINNYLNYNLEIRYVFAPNIAEKNIWRNTRASVYQYNYNYGKETMSTMVCIVEVPMSWTLFKLISGKPGGVVGDVTTPKSFTNPVYDSMKKPLPNDENDLFHTIFKSTIMEYMRHLAGKIGTDPTKEEAYKFLYREANADPKKENEELLPQFAEYISPNFIPDESFLKKFCSDPSNRNNINAAINSIKIKLDAHINFLRIALFHFINNVSRTDIFTNEENGFDDGQIKNSMNREFSTVMSNMAGRMGSLTGVVYNMMNTDSSDVTNSKKMPGIINSIVQYILQNTLRYNRLRNYYNYIKNNEKLIDFLYDKNLSSEIIDAITDIFPKGIEKQVIKTKVGKDTVDPWFIREVINDYKSTGIFDIEDPNKVFNNIGSIFNTWLAEINKLNLKMNDYDFSFARAGDRLEAIIKSINNTGNGFDNNEKQVMFDVLMCVSDVIFMLYRILLMCRMPQVGVDLPKTDRGVVLPTAMAKKNDTAPTPTTGTRSTALDTFRGDRWNIESDQLSPENVRQTPASNWFDSIGTEFSL